MAANPERGEVDLMAGEQTYTLRPTMNALCVVQKRTGQTYGQLVAAMATMDLTALRDLLFAFLQPYHAKQIKTVEAAGDVIDEAGGHSVVIGVVSEVLRLNAQRKRAGEESDPPTAQAGTGGSSGLTLAASA
jgi:hypothetical protein